MKTKNFISTQIVQFTIMNVIGTLIINSSYTLSILKKQFQKSCKMNVIYVTKKVQDTIVIMIIA